jgi:hypothetical protein
MRKLRLFTVLLGVVLGVAMLGSFLASTVRAELDAQPVLEDWPLPIYMYHAAFAGAESAPEIDSYSHFAFFVLGADTIRYRVCKDLTICYLEFPVPAPDIVTPVVQLSVVPMRLLPFEIAVVPPPEVERSRRRLLAIPIFIAAATLRRVSRGKPTTEPPAHVIPEPATVLLLGTGLAGVALYRKRKKR